MAELDPVVATDSGAGPLSAMVLEYEQAMKLLVPSVAVPADWEPLAEFVAVEDFERVGPFMEVQTWQEYTAMLTQWASSIDTFETTILRISELRDVVYFEIEERHSRRQSLNVVNSLTVFEFDAGRKIRRLRVYLQQPR